MYAPIVCSSSAVAKSSAALSVVASVSDGMPDGPGARRDASSSRLLRPSGPDDERRRELLGACLPTHEREMLRLRAEDRGDRHAHVLGRYLRGRVEVRADGLLLQPLQQAERGASA